MERVVLLYRIAIIFCIFVFDFFILYYIFFAKQYRGGSLGSIPKRCKFGSFSFFPPKSSFSPSAAINSPAKVFYIIYIPKKYSRCIRIQDLFYLLCAFSSSSVPGSPYRTNGVWSTSPVAEFRHPI